MERDRGYGPSWHDDDYPRGRARVRERHEHHREHEHGMPGRERWGERDEERGYGRRYRAWNVEYPGAYREERERRERDRDRDRSRRGPDYEMERDRWRGEREDEEGRGLMTRMSEGVRRMFGRERGPHWGEGPKGYRRSDQRIREDVCDRIAEDGWADASDVEIDVHEGEVTLSGTVHDRRDKRRIEDIADDVPGVRDIHNRIRVRRAEQRRDEGRDVS